MNRHIEHAHVANPKDVGFVVRGRMRTMIARRHPELDATTNRAELIDVKHDGKNHYIHYRIVNFNK